MTITNHHDDASVVIADTTNEHERIYDCDCDDDNEHDPDVTIATTADAITGDVKTIPEYEYKECYFYCNCRC